MSEVRSCKMERNKEKRQGGGWFGELAAAGDKAYLSGHTLLVIARNL
ncbi:hypothetical protein [Pedobacter sp. ASV28]|nr:hypothetical protein [Pedobacter sp. ASV28]